MRTASSDNNYKIQSSSQARRSTQLNFLYVHSRSCLQGSCDLVASLRLLPWWSFVAVTLNTIRSLPLNFYGRTTKRFASRWMERGCKIDSECSRRVDDGSEIQNVGFWKASKRMFLSLSGLHLEGIAVKQTPRESKLQVLGSYRYCTIQYKYR